LTGELNDENKFEEVLTCDLRSEQFLPYAKLIASLTQELNGFYNIGEFVHSDPKEISNFLMELGGFLRDYGCPYKTLLNNENRLADRTSRLQLLGSFFFCFRLESMKNRFLFCFLKIFF
jgi:hypothetical protein